MPESPMSRPCVVAHSARLNRAIRSLGTLRLLREGNFLAMSHLQIRYWLLSFAMNHPPQEDGF